MKTKFMSLMMIGAAALATRSPAWAAGQEITATVKGMVCGFCAQGIEKKFKADPAVEKVDVSLKEKQVKLTLKEGKELSDETVRKALADSGYNVESIARK